MIHLTFKSKLRGSRREIWDWMTSAHGIKTELRPLIRMTTPRDLRNIGDVYVEAGRPLFRSYLLLSGALPVDFSDLTLVELKEGHRFVEQSRMGTMKFWRHERLITENPGEPGSCILTDRLSFQPRFAAPAVGWFVRHLFDHRHQVLRRHFGGEALPEKENAGGEAPAPSSRL